MLTLKIAVIRIREIAGRVNKFKRRKAWRRHALVSAVTFVLAVSTMMFMTGVQFFANNVFITADDVTKKFFTTKEDAKDIIAEFGYTLGEFDRIIHNTNKDGDSLIDIVRGFGVEVVADGSTFTAGAVSGETADKILQASGIEVGKYDTIITGERSINLLRGFGVDVTADGKTVTIGTIGATVSELLQRAGVSVGENDIVSMPLEKQVAEGDSIIVKRVAYRERSDIELIPYDITVEYSNLVAIGEVKITDGINGEIASVYYEKLIDGVVVESETLSSEQIKSPEPKVITCGRALRIPYSKRDFPEIKLKNGIPAEYVKKISGPSTAYTAPSGAATASGRKLEVGTVAVDPSVIPYGSLLYIVSSCGNYVYGAAIAADTGGFVDFTHKYVAVDLFMGTTSQNYGKAVSWGMKDVDIYVINTGNY